eukprot:TRINITY_DN23084_c0_g2_i2.p1 TRINITY_DN23084_c0_g2~~TRINITY_DN23084_c0_g2_i2.p1  ORF type:complete len:334 (+),score=86.34 TRINITY_DN23084_c0_g2_i2:763-1764(+)
MSRFATPLLAIAVVVFLDGVLASLSFAVGKASPAKPAATSGGSRPPVVAKRSPVLFQTGAVLSKRPAPVVEAAAAGAGKHMAAEGTRSLSSCNCSFQVAFSDACCAALGAAFMLYLRAAWRGRRQRQSGKSDKFAEFGIEVVTPPPPSQPTIAETEARDAWGCTPLHRAATSGDAEATRRLLLKDADSVHDREAWDEQPLHLAARAGRLVACEALLKGRADVNAQNLDDETPLLVAAREGHEDVCRLLLRHGAGAGGAADAELPPLLVALLASQMISSPAEAESLADLDEEASASEPPSDYESDEEQMETEVSAVSAILRRRYPAEVSDAVAH